MLSNPSEFPWTSPPWLGGATKYRMGLRPIKPNRWFQGRPSLQLRVHKYGMLRRNYPQVVQTLPNTDIPQRLLANRMEEHGWFQPELQPTDIFPDLVAELSLQVADDLCLLEPAVNRDSLPGVFARPATGISRRKSVSPWRQYINPLQLSRLKLENRSGDLFDTLR